jgi:hypothetical protein
MAKKLPKKSAGPPFRAGVPTVTTGVRLTPGELAEIDQAAKRAKQTRGQLIREATLKLARKINASAGDSEP